jgi:hypothetical protein
MAATPGTTMMAKIGGQDSLKTMEKKVWFPLTQELTDIEITIMEGTIIKTTIPLQLSM